jgi:hypothetical protein
MNVLAFLTSICFRYHLWFYCYKSFCHSRIWHYPTIIQELCVWSFDILVMRLFLLQIEFFKNKGTSTQLSSLCAQLYPTEGSSGSYEEGRKARRWQVYYGLDLSSASWGPMHEAILASDHNLQIWATKSVSLWFWLQFARIYKRSWRRAIITEIISGDWDQLGITSEPGTCGSSGFLWIRVNLVNSLDCRLNRLFVLEIQTLGEFPVWSFSVKANES